jgi:hypothetical protein
MKWSGVTVKFLTTKVPLILGKPYTESKYSKQYHCRPGLALRIVGG